MFRKSYFVKLVNLSILLLSFGIGGGCGVSYNFVCMDASTGRTIGDMSVTSFEHGYNLLAGPIEYPKFLGNTDAMGKVHVGSSSTSGVRTIHFTKDGYYAATALIPDTHQSKAFVRNPEPEPIWRSSGTPFHGGPTSPDIPDSRGAIPIYFLPKSESVLDRGSHNNNAVEFKIVDAASHEPLRSIQLTDEIGAVGDLCGAAKVVRIYHGDDFGFISLRSDMEEKMSRNHHCLHFEATEYQAFSVIVTLVGRSIYLCKEYPGNLVAVVDAKNPITIQLQKKQKM